MANMANFLFFFLILRVYATDQVNVSENREQFKVIYQWHFLNFTWPNSEEYNTAVQSKKYVPENNAMAGIKIYKENLYVAMPRIRQGAPVTLGYINLKESKLLNQLITPFPSWKSNELGDCKNLLNVQSMEIDKNGTMWVLDGLRINDVAKCPPKLVLIDLEHEAGKILHTFTFSQQICLSQGGFLNDIVIDDSEGNFAYITDNSPIDPGLIVYSRNEDKAWKLRDRSMFPEIDASNYLVGGLNFTKLAPIDGIALSTTPPDNTSGKSVYFCSLTGYNLYSINTDILKNEEYCGSGDWRSFVIFVGRKQAQSDGLIIDNKGNLYYGLLPLYGVGKWNTKEPFSKSEIIQQDEKTMVWTDSFGFDDKGYLYLLTNNIHKFFDPNYKFDSNTEVKIRIFKRFTSTNSYLYV